MFLAITVVVILGISQFLDTEFYLMFSYLYKVSQELRSIFWDLISELMLTKSHIPMGPIRNSSEVMNNGQLLRYVFKWRVTGSQFMNQARCSKCPPPAWKFLTRVTTELITLQSTAALLMLLAVLRIQGSSFLSCSPCVHTP